MTHLLRWFSELRWWFARAASHYQRVQHGTQGGHQLNSVSITSFDHSSFLSPLYFAQIDSNSRKTAMCPQVPRQHSQLQFFHVFAAASRLPPHILDAQALEIFGRQLSLQECALPAIIRGCHQSAGLAVAPAYREWYWWFFSHGFYPVITPMLSLFHYVPPFSTVFHHSSCQHIVAKILAQTSDFLWPSSPEISEISWHQVSTWLSWWVSVQRNCLPCVCRPPPSSSSCLTWHGS